MISQTKNWAERLFPERQILVRSGEHVRYIAFPAWTQAGVLLGLIGLIGGLGGLTGAYLHLHRTIHRKEAAISAVSSRVAAIANLRDLLATADEQYLTMSDQLNEMRQDLATTTADNSKLQTSVEAAEARGAVLDKERLAVEAHLQDAEALLAHKSGNLSALAHRLASNREELHAAEAARAQAQKKLHSLQADAENADTRTAKLKLALNAREAQLKAIAADRNRLRAQLQQQSSLAPANESANESRPSRSSERVSSGYIGELRRLIASTGIDLNKLLGQLNSVPSGEGGPYVALSMSQEKEAERERVAALQSLAKSLPLDAPLKHFVLESPFGARMDPFRHRMGFHTGVDLAAPYKSPVYSTAPGTISFTGWKEGYGRVVEISHAHGIVTLYAHLNRILVARGQYVRAHQEIGLLGSTGRSTGPHVHYEVRVNGVPVNPEKFIEAGKGVVAISAK